MNPIEEAITMERGNAKHSARADDELARELDAQLQRGGAQPDPSTEPEPMTDDIPGDEPVADEPQPARRPSPADMAARARLRHDPAVTEDLGPADTVRGID